jgi:LPS-assembly protein
VGLKNKIIPRLFAITLIISYVFSSVVFAEQDKTTEVVPQPPKEPIVVNGDNVEYFQEKKMVVGSGNVSITYKDIILTCDKITVYLDTRESIAEGNVKVTQQGAYFTGERMNYNFETKKGTVLQGYVNAKPFYGKANEVNKIENKDQFKLDEGYVTTCDLDKPHYRVRAKQIMVYLNDKVVARHIVTYLGNVPVLYWPYYVQPLTDKKSHITVIPGTRKEWGYYALTSYRYYLGDKNCGDLLLDYRTKKGLAEGVNHYYHTNDLGDGAVKLYYTRENQFVYETDNSPITKYRWQVRHEWEMSEGTDTVATFEFNKLSDRDVIKDYFYNEYEEIGATPDNYISFITQKEAFSTEFLIRPRLDKFFNVTERLPEFKITIPDNNFIPNTRFYYKANASAGYLNNTYDNTNTATPQKDMGSGRIDAYNQLSYAFKFFRSLSVVPYAGVEDTYYSKLVNGDRNQTRNIFSFGVNNSIKFYKIYDVESNFLGLDIHKLRHVITPTANYGYVHTPSIDPSKIIQFDAIDGIDKSNGIAFGLENRLQTKRPDENGNMKSVDLATLKINTNYIFRLKKDSFAMNHDKFDGVQFKLELIPYNWAYLEAELDTDPKTYGMQRSSIDLVAHWKDKWSAAISERYENVSTGSNSLLTFDGTYKINEKWKVRVYERYNNTKAAFEEQAFTVTRDLHCWIGEFTYTVSNDGDQGLWFILKLKAFPQTPIGLKQTYSHPRFGEAGTQ